MQNKIYKFITETLSRSKYLLVIFCCLIILIQTVQIIYFKRAFFREAYNVPYWKDRFEHSQWVLPLSKRIIGDDGLFSYIGYGLINNTISLDGFNAETPPVGKYLIGLSILIFRNPAYYALFLGIGSLFLFFLISKKLLGSSIFALFATALFFVDPLFINQFWKAWVDISQLFFLLVNLFLFIIFVNKKNNKTLILSLLIGLSLGLFTQTKPPILLPIIFFLESGFFIYIKKIKEYIIFTFGIFIGILIPYGKFFFDGNSLIDFLSLQKYIVDFYLRSQVVVHKEAIWQTLFLGKFPNISDGSLTSVTEWWIIWPTISIIGIITSIIFLLKKGVNLFWKGISIFTLLTLIVYTFIPAYPRYLMIVLPFLYLLFVKVVVNYVNNRKEILIFVVIIFYGIVHSTFFLQPKSELVLNNFYYNLSNQYFQDIYHENIAKLAFPKMSRGEFRLHTQGILDKATVAAIEIKELKRDISVFANRGLVEILVKYKTRGLGAFFENKSIELIKEDGQWKIIWDWDLVLNGFLPEHNVETIISQGKRGRILDSGGNVLVEDINGYLITVNPQEIDLKKENEMLDFLSKIGYVKNVHLQNAYLENMIPGSDAPLFTLFTNLTNNLKEKILSYKGVKIIHHIARIYYSPLIEPLGIQNLFYEECCTRIYSSYNYHGVKGEEKQYDKILSAYDGGIIKIKDKNGRTIRTVIEKSKRDGQDITIYDGN